MDAEQTIATPSDEGSPQFLVIHYQENNVDPISPLSDNDMPQASHIEEGFLLACCPTIQMNRARAEKLN